MSFDLSEREARLVSEFHALKAESGSHSPSLHTLRDRLPGVDIGVDGCFLSNPYATDLFISRLTSDLVETGELRNVLEFYPSQNRHVASLLEPVLGIDHDKLFVCNGAIEAIQAGIHRFGGTRVGVVIPTFSPYYEYLRPDQEPVFYRLERENEFALDVDDFVDFVHGERLDTVCLINPNNPNGGYVNSADMRRMLDEFAGLDLVILDESFVDFAYEDEQRSRLSLALEASRLENVMLVKSMSKDFGIAGLRAGYAVMNETRCSSLLGNGYLWNIGGLCEFFFRLFAEAEFQARYTDVRLRYLDEAREFFDGLGSVDGLQAFETKANFCLVRLDDALPVDMVVPLLLIRYGVYLRDCSDKIGLDDGHYIRIAGRTRPENEAMLAALRSVVAEWMLV
jgi:histidinol-phosphate/aromatic aminotransferase/cobyric acid decarboxylase-like protein